jgi:hypothetical protein
MVIIIRDMPGENAGFDIGKMTDRSLAKKSSAMSGLATTAVDTGKEESAKRQTGEVKKAG